MIRKATAVWKGSGKDGKGHVSTPSTVLDKTQYSYLSRFEDGVGTNPEELIAAAHSGCFAMKLSFNLSGIGFVPDELDVTCNITFEEGVLKKSHLVLKATVPGISEEQFAEQVKDAEENCPISKVLNTEISVEYTLN
ncbi:OsmC family protein [Algoriphagus zhangzhouensis]|jgi:osmotically inducible protein OsmC|uniref:Osmotically inducible protein OsmC n=1 Tax=Algoriphagus zhangzhouensis TaxID=1073327 RepID=A0A1M7ZAT3_9BACT|nr:OsmC family protein [Algoriphagus zhangzhouensis]TDY47132.1 osmotically inducible protein OsmC [Algoriphagus zhangzhouensis]SHO61909.1 osmotically inducible protein OsmC [Algoriphagus zhangzhouensis]